MVSWCQTLSAVCHANTNEYWQLRVLKRDVFDGGAGNGWGHLQVGRPFPEKGPANSQKVSGDSEHLGVGEGGGEARGVESSRVSLISDVTISAPLFLSPKPVGGKWSTLSLVGSSCQKWWRDAGWKWRREGHVFVSPWVGLPLLMCTSSLWPPHPLQAVPVQVQGINMKIEHYNTVSVM